jgi:hypothetical protein
MTKEASTFQAAQIQQEGREGNAPNALCNLPPMQQEGPSFGVASIPQEGAGRGTGSAGRRTDGDWPSLSIAGHGGKVKRKVGEFHGKKGRKERKKGKKA